MSEKIKYLYDNKQISDILAQGFAKICQQKPKFPINYLARYLKNHTSKNNQKSSLIDRIQQNTKTSQHLIEQQQTILHQLQAKVEQSKTQQKSKQQFLSKISSTQRHQQILDQFCEQVCKRLQLGGVYIGQLEHQVKKIDLMQEDGQEAHLELEKQKVVKFKYASQGQRDVIVGKILSLQSVVGKLVTQVDEPVGEQENGQGQQGGKVPEIKGQVYFPSVVGREQLRFFRYPRLGAYFACSLRIKSFLQQKLLDQNKLKVQNNRKVQHQFQKQLQQKQTKFRELYQQKAHSGAEQKQLQQMQQQFQRQKSQLPHPTMQQFSYHQRRFVICADTLGLDKEITESQKRQLRHYIQHLKLSWQSQQQKQLSSDINAQLQMFAPSHDDGHDGQVPNYQEQLGLLIQEEEKEMPSHEEVQKVKDNQKLLELETNTIRLEKTKEYLTEERFLKHWDHLLLLNVVKYPQVIKQFLILLGYTKEQFCTLNSNVLDWLKTRQLLKTQANQILQTLNTINPRGSRPQLFPSFAKCHRIAKNIEGLQLLTIANYNIYLALILRLLQLYTKTRVQDRDARVARIQLQREIREQKIKEAEDKANQKRQKLETIKAELQEKGQLETFDEQTWSSQWDEENPIVEIPEEIPNDVDRDLEELEQGQNQQQKGQ